MWIFTVFSVFSFWSSAYSRPLTGPLLQYAPSNIYTYKYTTEVAFNEPHSQKDTQPQNSVGFRLNCDVILTPVWHHNDNMLVKLTIKRPVLHSVSRSNLKQDVKTLVKTPLYFTWDGGRIAHVYTASNDPVWSANMKIGLTSLLQLQRDNTEVMEEDISGRCNVAYRAEGNKIVKTKSNCVPVINQGEFTNANTVLGVTTKSTTETRFELKEDIIQSASSIEFHITYINAKEDLSSAVFSKQHLDLDNVVSGAVKVQASSMQEAVTVLSTREKLTLVKRPALYMVDEKACPADGCKQFSQVIDGIRKEMGTIFDSPDVMKIQPPTMFLQILDIMRSATKATVLTALRDPNNGPVLPLLIDAAVAAQTSACQMALMEMLDFTDTYDISLQERYLLAVAFSTHPSEFLLTDLLNILRKGIADERLEDSTAQSLSAVTYTYCQTHIQSQNQQLVQDIQTTLLEKLTACGDINCKSRYIRALGNAALPATLNVLLHHIVTDKDVAAESAIKALRRFDKQLLKTEKTRSTLMDVYVQRHRGYDSIVRTQALQVLLKLGVTAEDITDFFRETTDPTNTEFDLYVQARLSTAANRNLNISNYIKQSLQRLNMSNYDALAPKGNSLAFKSNLSDMKVLDVTYDMYVQNSAAGVLKRSGMDVDVNLGNTTLPLYSFGIFAAGVGGLVGEVEEGEEDVEPTAGLFLNMLDVSLRPVTFFVGKTGLMSAVWNAPSQLISALQASFLLQDHNDIVYLQNGMKVQHEVQGAITIDLSGLLSISLWNKNCHSYIKNSVSMAVRGRVVLETSVFRAGLEYTAQAMPVIDFTSDVDFYDKIKMCLQMGRPFFTYSHHVHKTEHANGFRKKYAAHIRRKSNVPSVSYPLPKPNYEQCRNLLNKS